MVKIGDTVAKMDINIPKLEVDADRNIIYNEDEIKIVPITDTLDDIDKVKYIVSKVIDEQKNEGKMLSIKGYLINDIYSKVRIEDGNIDKINCPFRKIYRRV